uniref:Uncharacterized protein n=1 Tax=Neolamprologus brichardi TaxID=32507 RepID=A0A3Q4HH61_NEOBR
MKRKTAPAGRDINNNPKEAIVASHQSGKGIKAIFKPVYNSNLTKIIHKWKTFEKMTSPLVGIQSEGSLTLTDGWM